jgi:hypothetical protein
MALNDVPVSTNADGRYYWYGDFQGVTGGQINFVGDPNLLTGNAALTWTILQRASDGSYPVISYATSGLAAPVQTAPSTATSGGTLAAGTYYYKITALNANGETIASNEVSQVTTGSASTVTLNWQNVAGATGYRIYRGVTVNGENTYYQVGAVLTYADTGSAGTVGAPPTSTTAYVSVSAQVGSEGTPQETINESGIIKVNLANAQTFIINVTSGGGSNIPGATQWIVALAITRNTDETLPWDFPNPFDPIAYNCDKLDFSGYPSATLGQLRTRLAIRSGFAAQASNLPPGMVAFFNDHLFGSQNYLYRKYPALHTRRFFRWKVIPGQRFYSLKDNDDDVLGNFHLDPLKTIEWVGIQDTRNVWYPMIEGIPPQLYTMITKPWRPARYDIRQGIEIYPAPDQTYFLWVRGHFGLLSFVNDTDASTIDSELIFLHALANVKAHYGHSDASNIEAQANSYRGELIAGTHKTAHYIPGVIAVPPAVRPTLIQFNPQGS